LIKNIIVLKKEMKILMNIYNQSVGKTIYPTFGRGEGASSSLGKRPKRREVAI
jgi:hypothetical protein